MWVWLTPWKICFSSPEFGHSKSNDTSVIIEIICQKILTPSRSLINIGTDMDRSATYDFLLVIHSNHGPVSYRFRAKRQFMSKIANSSDPVCLTTKMWEFLLEFCIIGSAKNRVMPLPDDGKSLTICAFVRYNTKV